MGGKRILALHLILFFSLFSFLVSADNCEILNTSKTLTSDISVNGSCFLVNDYNIVIDGAGYTITGNGTGNGIEMAGFSNITVINFGGIINFKKGVDASGMVNLTVANSTIQTANVSQGYGIQISTTINSTLINNIINASSITGAGIRISGVNSYNNNISYNNITTVAEYNTFGIWISSAHDNFFVDNQVITNSSDAYGIYLSDADDNVFVGGWTEAKNSSEFYADTSVGNSVYYMYLPGYLNLSGIFSNVSIDTNSSAPDASVGSQVLPYRLLIQNLSPYGFVNFNLSYTEIDLENLVESSMLLYRHNGSGWVLLPNSSVNISNNIVSSGMVTNFSLFAPIADTLVTCGYIQNDTVFDRNLESNGTCLIVNKSNIVIDGNSFNMTGDDTGYGIDNSGGFDNITIKNFGKIQNFHNAIYFSGVENSTIFNNTIINNVSTPSMGGVLFVQNSSRNNFSSNNLSMRGEYAYAINLSHSDYNLFMDNEIFTDGLYAAAFRLEASRFNTITTTDADTDDSVVQLVNGSDWNSLQSNNLSTDRGHSYGIYMESSAQNNASNNIISTVNSPVHIEPSPNMSHYHQRIDSSNTAGGEPIHYLFSNASVVIENLDSIGQLILANTTNITVQNVSMNVSGITILHSSHASILSGNISTGERCIWVDGSPWTTILNMNLSACDDSFHLFYSNHTVITNLTITADDGDDILEIRYSDNMTITYLNITGDVDEIGYLRNSNSLFFQYNHIAPPQGTDFDICGNENSSIHNNTFFAGLRITCSENSTITHNYWGSTSVSSISSNLEDVHDNIGDGIIFFCPFLNASPPGGTPVNCSGAQITMDSPSAGSTITSSTLSLDVVTNESSVCYYGIDTGASTTIPKLVEYRPLFGAPMNSSRTSASDSDLSLLDDGGGNNGNGWYSYDQFLYWPSASVSGSEGSYQLDFQAGEKAYNYHLDFTTAIEGDVGSHISHFEGAGLTLAGTSFTIISALRPSQHSLRLALGTHTISGAQNIGETKTREVNGTNYTVTLTFVDSTRARFSIDGEVTPILSEGHSHIMSTGVVIGVEDIIYQSCCGGVQYAEYFMSSSLLMLNDTNITDQLTSSTIEVGNISVADTYAMIVGSDDGSTVTINDIYVHWAPTSTVSVPETGYLSTYATQNQMPLDFDIAFFNYTSGLSPVVCMGEPSMSAGSSYGNVNGDGTCVGSTVTFSTNHSEDVSISALSEGSHTLNVGCWNERSAFATTNLTFTYDLPEESNNDNSGGGGGGGGGGGSAAPSDSSSVSHVLATASSSDPIEINVNKESIPVTSLQIEMSDDASDVEVKITALDEVPDGTPALVISDAALEDSGTSLSVKAVYGYLDIEHENIAGKIKNANIGFKVNQTWISDNQHNKSDVSLLRYSGSSWTDLPTIVEKESSNYVYYSASTNNFSVFAISVKKAEAKISKNSESVSNESMEEEAIVVDEPQSKIVDNSSTTEAPIENRKRRGWLLATLVIVMLAGSFLGWYTMKYRASAKKTKDNPQRDLQGYIGQSKNKGHSDEEIRSKLIASGWDQATVENALERNRKRSGKKSENLSQNENSG